MAPAAVVQRLREPSCHPRVVSEVAVRKCEPSVTGHRSARPPGPGQDLDVVDVQDDVQDDVQTTPIGLCAPRRQQRTHTLCGGAAVPRRATKSRSGLCVVELAALPPRATQQGLKPRRSSRMADALGGDRPPLSAVDITTLGVYFVCLFAIGLWSCRRKNSDSTSYFLAERAVPWWAVAASLFASNVSFQATRRAPPVCVCVCVCGDAVPW